MEASNNSNAEYKHKQRFSIPDSCSRDGPSCSRDGPSASASCSQWQNTVREARRDTGKNGDRSHDGWGRNRPLHGKNRENFSEDQSRDRHREEKPPSQQPQQVTSSFPAYSYNASEHYVDHSQRTMSVMPYGYMNSQWGINPLDAMPVAQSNLPVTSPTPTGMPMVPSMEMMPTTNTGINPYAFMGIAADNNMYGMMGMGNFCQYGMINGQENLIVNVPKQVFTLSNCMLIPPNPNKVHINKHPKPLGCRTVFVGNLPENITEETIREIFEKCGEIVTIRMSKRNFCHIRFASEEHVENAMYFTGYKIKFDDKDETAYLRGIHVDYANAKDDQYEYECQQRALKREARHREQQEQEYCRPPTPPPVVHYSDHEATSLVDKLKNEETFQQGIFVLITWLERGECSKQNSGYFYSMIQSANSHVRRLIGEKQKYEDELLKAKTALKQQMQEILLQFIEIEKVFNAASLQKVWDHFTKPQRKSISLWKTQTSQYKLRHIDEMLHDRDEDEMEVCDGNSPERSKDGSDDESKESMSEKLAKLREENDVLHCQLEAANNEIAVLLSDNREYKTKIDKLEVDMKKLKEESDMKLKPRYRGNLDNDHKDSPNDISDMDCIRDGFGPSVSSSSCTLEITETEAHLVGLISTFLNVHPFGASIDYICSYLHQIDNTFKARDVENLMKRFPSLFKEESSGIGASLEKKWFFFGFKL